MGKKGLKEVATHSLKKAHYAAREISKLDGFEITFTNPYFKEFAVSTEKTVFEINQYLKENKFIGGYDLEEDYEDLSGNMLIAVTEKRTRDEIDKLVQLLEEIK